MVTFVTSLLLISAYYL